MGLGCLAVPTYEPISIWSSTLALSAVVPGVWTAINYRCHRMLQNAPFKHYSMVPCLVAAVSKVVKWLTMAVSGYDIICRPKFLLMGIIVYRKAKLTGEADFQTEDTNVGTWIEQLPRLGLCIQFSVCPAMQAGMHV